MIGKTEFDPFPAVHTREILATESHRHPYVEAMGMIYMMKLRYKTEFCSNVGSCWRLIFVYALMPWMQKYRLFVKPTVTGESSPGGEAPQDGNDDLVPVSSGNLELDAASTVPIGTPRMIAHKTLVRRESSQKKKETMASLRQEIERLQKALAKAENRAEKKVNIFPWSV